MKKIISKLFAAAAIALLVIGVISSDRTVMAAAYGADFESAGTLSLGKEYKGSLDPDAGYKSHWYSFTTNKSDDYYYCITYNTNYSVGSLQVNVKTESGKSVVTVNKGSSEKEVRLEPATKYYVEVYSSSSVKTGDGNQYSFIINPIDDPETDSMGNVSIELKSKKAYEGKIVTSYEEDWFFFKAKADKATVQISKNDKNWGLTYGVYDKNGTRIKVETLGSGYSDSYTINTVKGEKYYVCLSSGSNFDHGEEDDDRYSVTVDCGSIDVGKLSTPACLFAGTKVVAGEAIPGATVKCTFGKKTFSAKANENGLYIIKLSSALKKGNKVTVWQTLDGTASPKLTAKVNN